jgi:hypothetical protein
MTRSELRFEGEDLTPVAGQRAPLYIGIFQDAGAGHPAGVGFTKKVINKLFWPSRADFTPARSCRSSPTISARGFLHNTSGISAPRKTARTMLDAMAEFSRSQVVSSARRFVLVSTTPPKGDESLSGCVAEKVAYVPGDPFVLEVT